MAAGHGGSELVTADATAGTVTSRRPPARSRDDRAPDRCSRRWASGCATNSPNRRNSPRTARSTHRGVLGWYGWFGYELGAQLDGVATSPAETPDAAFLFVDRAIVFDHAARSVRLVWIERRDDGATRPMRGRRSSVRPSSARTGHPCRRSVRRRTRLPMRPRCAGGTTPRGTPNSSPTARPRSCAGDAYQLCLTNRSRRRRAGSTRVATYLALRALEPEPPRRLPAVRRRRAAERVARAVPARRRPTASSRPSRSRAPGRAAPTRRPTRPARRAAREREGARREPHDRRPHAQRPRPHRRARQRERAEPARGRGATRTCISSCSTVRARIRAAARPRSTSSRPAFPAGSMTGAPKHSAMSILARARAGAARHLLGCVRLPRASTAARRPRDGHPLDRARRPRARASAPAAASRRSRSPTEEIAETRVKARGAARRARGGTRPARSE